jgi:hypothetical protein
MAGARRWQPRGEATNRRYTSDHAERDDMGADPATWTPEGYGPDSVIMCAPVGS